MLVGDGVVHYFMKGLVWVGDWLRSRYGDAHSFDGGWLVVLVSGVLACHFGGDGRDLIGLVGRNVAGRGDGHFGLSRGGAG